MAVHGKRTWFGIVIGRSLFGKERAMKRAIVAFMVVAGMGLMMAGCGESSEPTKGGAPANTAGAQPTPKAPAPGEK
jgi:hypothetical protein